MSTEILTVKLEALHSDVSEIKSSLDKVSEAITKLALVEQQQGGHGDSRWGGAEAPDDAAPMAARRARAGNGRCGLRSRPPVSA